MRLLAAALSLLVLAAGVASARPPNPGPARVQVTAKEFFLALSRRSIASGPAIVELVNFGEDAHDLRLQRIGGRHVYRTPVVQSGDYFDLGVTLGPGRYRLWCGVANHRQLGMNAVLTVKGR